MGKTAMRKTSRIFILTPSILDKGSSSTCTGGFCICIQCCLRYFCCCIRLEMGSLMKQTTVAASFIGMSMMLGLGKW